MIYNIYTDGSCNNKDGVQSLRKGGWAFMIVAPEGEDWTAHNSGQELNASSQRMEMMAVIKALECIIDAPQLFRKQFTYNIVSDSAYIVNCFNDKWYERWWTENYLFVKNEDLWKIMFKLAFNFNRGIKFNFVKVKGHSGDKYNEIVDKLAHEARIKTE